MKVHTSPIFLLLLLTVLEMEDFKEEEIFIIGEFGQQVQTFKHTKMLLDLLIVNLGLNLYQYGKLSFNLQNLRIENIKQDNFNLIKDMEVDLILLEDI
jgi:hypothetical protein